MLYSCKDIICSDKRNEKNIYHIFFPFSCSGSTVLAYLHLFVSSLLLCFFADPLYNLILIVSIIDEWVRYYFFFNLKNVELKNCPQFVVQVLLEFCYSAPTFIQIFIFCSRSATNMHQNHMFLSYRDEASKELGQNFKMISVASRRKLLLSTARSSSRFHDMSFQPSFTLHSPLVTP